jgi:pyrimidine deaminase RibD-like protein
MADVGRLPAVYAVQARGSNGLRAARRDPATVAFPGMERESRSPAAMSTRTIEAPPSSEASPTAHELMQRAIDEMQLSRESPAIVPSRSIRAAGIEVRMPVVGAALCLPGGKVVAAHRGELRLGDHAEYTLLNRKLGGRRLEGSRLFVTLEPCAPGALGWRRAACATSIVRAGIRDVWIAIDDPYPTVGGRGRQFLADSGVRLHPFDDDFTAQVTEANRDFLAFATEVATRGLGPRAPGPLTRWLARFAHRAGR